MKQGSSEDVRVAINTMRARLTILGFNLAVVTFQLGNMRVLGGGITLDGFKTAVHLSAGTLLLIGVALSLASIAVFLSASAIDREGTCDRRMLLAGDGLMYLALAQTVTGFFSPYRQALEAASFSTGVEGDILADIQIGMMMAGSASWFLITFVGPGVSLARSPNTRFQKLLHVIAYGLALVFVSRVWWAGQLIEGRGATGDGSLSAWLCAFAAPLYW